MRTEGARSATVSTNSIGFWRTSVKTDGDFLTMTNGLFNQGFVTASVAANWLLANGYWTSWDTLGTLKNPAVSAQAIYDSGQTTDAWYYIQTSNMESPRQIYCNMTDEGGGWMLMTYNPYVSISPGTPYPNQWLGGTGSFASTISIDTRQVWYHSGTAQCTQLMKMASTTATLTPLLSNMEVANKVVYNNPNTLKLSGTFSSVLYVAASPDGGGVRESGPYPFTLTGTWSGIKPSSLLDLGSLPIEVVADWMRGVVGDYWIVSLKEGTIFASTYIENSIMMAANGGPHGTSISGMSNGSGPNNRTDIKTYAIFIK